MSKDKKTPKSINQKKISDYQANKTTADVDVISVGKTKKGNIAKGKR